MTPESRVQMAVRLAIGQMPLIKLFRNNRGIFWTGTPSGAAGSLITLSHPRRVECGLINGASDLIGWTSITITADMLGKQVAVFTAAEVKPERGGRITDEQKQFISTVRKAGGISGIVRSSQDALDLVARGIQ